MELIISPHMDDAFLSMGGSLLLHNIHTHILTVFNSAWSCYPLFDNKYDINQLNKVEHEKVLHYVNSSFSYWDYPESFQRGYLQWDTPLDLKTDEMLFHEIKERLMVLFTDMAYDAYFFPMAIESHADHELIFLALIEILNKRIINCKQVYLYEDLPYSFYVNMDDWVLVRKTSLDMSPIDIDITEVLDRKCKILELYKTQVEQRDIYATMNYAKKIIGNGRAYERLWKITGIRQGRFNG